MNWDTGTWQAIPQDMLQAAQAEEAAIIAEEEQQLAQWNAQHGVSSGNDGGGGGGDGGGGGGYSDGGGGGGDGGGGGGGGADGEWGYGEEEEEVDLRAGEYNHPVHGVVPTYLFENNRNSRLYFSEASEQWTRMPLTWERSIPEVKALLAEIDSAFPQWNNVTEQLLVLRECNYNLQDTLSFGEENFGWKVVGVDGGHAVNEHKMRRHNSRMSNRRRSHHSVSSMTSISSIDDLLPAPTTAELGPLSAKAAGRLDELDVSIRYYPFSRFLFFSFFPFFLFFSIPFSVLYWKIPASMEFGLALVVSGCFGSTSFHRIIC